MAPRSLWNGYLKLSLVSCPIALYPAISSAEGISFRQVNKATGNRLRQQLIDRVTGETVESREKGRGYEVGENQFVLVKDEDLEAARREARTRSYGAAAVTAQVQRREEQSRLPDTPKGEADKAPPPIVAPSRPRLENTHTIEIERFVPLSQLDPRYYHTPYYVVPRGEEIGREAFAVIRDAMAGKELVAMGRVVLSNRERSIIVEPMHKGLRALTLRYTHEVRSALELFAGIPELILPKEMLGVAENILEAMKADFDPSDLEDRYRTALSSMLREKQPKAPRPTGSAVPSRENVISLMDILERSLAAKRPSLRSPAKSKPAGVAARAKSGSSKRSRPSARRTRSA